MDALEGPGFVQQDKSVLAAHSDVVLNLSVERGTEVALAAEAFDPE